MVTLCQCNIHDGGRHTGSGGSTVTYDTARNLAQWVASINPSGSTWPPIAAIGMQELLSETDRSVIEGYLEQYTGISWESARTAQGVNGGSGIGFFWRPDLVETRPEWHLGEKTLEQIDNGYVLKFAGRLFRKQGAADAFGLFTGKLLWDGAILNGRRVTEDVRLREAVDLKQWIAEVAPDLPHAILTDLNAGVGTPTWNEMSLDYTDPSSQHTAGSCRSDLLLDRVGRRLDYIWLSRGRGCFVDGPRRSAYFGSDHRAVYATIDCLSNLV